MNGDTIRPDGDVERVAAARSRLRGFHLHLAAFAIVVAALIAIGLVFDPGASWIVVPPVAWGSVLALHAAYAMGLFDAFRGGRR